MEAILYKEFDRGVELLLRTFKYHIRVFYKLPDGANPFSCVFCIVMQ